MSFDLDDTRKLCKHLNCCFKPNQQSAKKASKRIPCTHFTILFCDCSWCKIDTRINVLQITNVILRCHATATRTTSRNYYCNTNWRFDDSVMRQYGKIEMALNVAVIQRIQFEYNDSRSHCIVTQRTNDIIIWLQSNENREKRRPNNNYLCRSLFYKKNVVRHWKP